MIRAQISAVRIRMVTDWVIHRTIDWLIDWSIDWSMDSLVDGLIDWLSDWNLLMKERHFRHFFVLSSEEKYLKELWLLCFFMWVMIKWAIFWPTPYIIRGITRQNPVRGWKMRRKGPHSLIKRAFLWDHINFNCNRFLKLLRLCKNVKKVDQLIFEKMEKHDGATRTHFLVH